MATKFGLFFYKIAYKSVCTPDRPDMFGPTGGDDHSSTRGPIFVANVAKQLVRLPSKAYIYSSVWPVCTLIGCQLGWTSPLSHIFGKPITDWVSTYLVVTENTRARPRLTDSEALKRNMCRYYVIN